MIDDVTHILTKPTNPVFLVNSSYWSVFPTYKPVYFHTRTCFKDTVALQMSYFLKIKIFISLDTLLVLIPPALSGVNFGAVALKGR